MLSHETVAERPAACHLHLGAPDAAHAYSDSPMMSGPMLPKFGFPMATAYTVLTRMKVKISSQPAAWQLT